MKVSYFAVKKRAGCGADKKSNGELSADYTAAPATNSVNQTPMRALVSNSDIVACVASVCRTPFSKAGFAVVCV